MTELIPFKEFCKNVLKANENTVKTWRRRGDLPEKIFLRIGGTLYVKKDKFDQWIEYDTEGRGNYYGDI